MIEKINNLKTNASKPIFLINEEKLNRVFGDRSREDIAKQHAKNKKSANRLNIVSY